MGRDQSAYAVLGLEPGADPELVVRAYKRLIKEHHPDRAGGDVARAAGINRAYRELRAALRIKDDLTLHPLFPERSAGWSRTVWAAALVVVLGSAALILSVLAPEPSSQPPGLGPHDARRAAHRIDVMDQPLSLSAIDGAVADAAQLARTSDEMALAGRSRDCQAVLRHQPNIRQFDRCAAFDNAVIRLQDRDPLRDRGTFSQIAVTGRLFSAAADLSGDYMATDSRLRRIRVRVELLLAPAEVVGPAGN